MELAPGQGDSDKHEAAVVQEDVNTVVDFVVTTFCFLVEPSVPV